MDPHRFGNLGPHRSGKHYPDPHPPQSEKKDPDPHQSEKVEGLDGHF